MVRPASSPTETPRLAPSISGKNLNYPRSLLAEFASLLRREPAGLAGVVGWSANSAKNLSEVVAGDTAKLAPQLKADPDAAKDSTQKGELDPLQLSLSAPCGAFSMAPTPLGGAVGELAKGERAAPISEAALVEEVVRRVSWGGDRRRGVARIELGGALAGTTILVQGEGRSVALDIELAPGVEAGELPARLAARFAARGLELRSLDVR